ncbi:alpha/beta hydrolase-fold protein [Novosphingobium sp.]|uniref:alpha/beta hydrolase n=1 Tax=Novosphingobium sp. TaxID=1874826 RepID=UPI0031DD5527
MPVHLRVSAFLLATGALMSGGPVVAQGGTCLKPWYTPLPPPVRSVEVLPDHRLTFRLCAPEAREVLATSPDAAPVIPQGFPAGTPMGLVLTRDASGLWSGTTTGPVAPGPYRYGFRVDGVRTVDPYARSFSQTRYGIEAVVEVPGATFQAWDATIPHGAVATVDYWSKSLKVRRRAHVYTPPGYEKGAAARYPVLYLVHGSGDNDDSWVSIGHANQILDRLIASGEARPMIVVMPDGHLPDADRATDFHAAGFGADLTRDLIPLIDGTYRTVPTAEARAMAGLSMGGSHTIREGLTRPDTFHWLGIFSMGMGVGSQTGVSAKATDDFAAAHDDALKAAARSVHLVYFGMGREDGLYPSAAPTVAVLDRYRIRHIYRESGGGHTWINWRDYLNEFAPMLFQPVRPR